jgi:hypothetical protein
LRRAEVRAEATVRRALGCALVLLLAGCVGSLKTGPAGSRLAESKGITVSPQELRIRVRALASPYIAIIERAADKIIAEDPSKARLALQWKARAVPVMQNAVFLADPIVALLDSWAFASQMRHYFESGPGREEFGESWIIAARACARIERISRDLVRRISPPGTAERATHFVEAWVDRYPIDNLDLGRISIKEETASAAARGDIGVLAAVGTALESLDDLTTRIASYVEVLPRQARWEAELAAVDISDLPATARMARDLNRMVGAVEQIGELSSQVPGLVTRERSALLATMRDERREVMAEIDRQRVDVMRSLDDERAKIVADTRTLAADGLRQSSLEAQKIIDHIFWRALQFTAVVMLFLLAAGVIALLLVRSRPHAPLRERRATS